MGVVGAVHRPDGVTELPTHSRQEVPLAIDRPTASIKRDASQRAFIGLHASATLSPCCLAIENGWTEAMGSTTMYHNKYVVRGNQPCQPPCQDCEMRIADGFERRNLWNLPSHAMLLQARFRHV